MPSWRGAQLKHKDNFMLNFGDMEEGQVIAVNAAKSPKIKFYRGSQNITGIYTF
jgi:hypothetical protein